METVPESQLTVAALPESVRSRLTAFFTLALPIIGGQVSLILMGAIDIAMVGRLGTASIAAAGVGTMLNGAFSALLFGVGGAVQILVARRLGENREREAGPVLTEALRLAAVAGLPVSLVAAWIAPMLFGLVNTDTAVIEAGVPYLIARNLGLFFYMSTFIYQGFYNGIHRPMDYLRVIVLIQILNVGLNAVLIYGAGPISGFGVLGAGIGSSLAFALGSGIYLLRVRSLRARFNTGARMPADQRARSRRTLGKLAGPLGLQDFSIIAAFLIFMRLADQVSVVAVAASSILFQLVNVYILPGFGFGQAAATLVSRSLGERHPREARRWGLFSASTAAGILLPIGLFFLAAPHAALSFFSAEEAVMLQAVPILRLLGAMLALDAFALVLGQGLMGSGAVIPVLAWSFVGLGCIFLPGAWLFGVNQGHGLAGLWLPLFVGRAVTALAILVLFQRGRWQRIQL
ncbi:MAG: MATE family efflux transporter [Acidobacteriota bacterium]|nr:MATE family efflux transporter [Acidobacteriota bacterium]